jgi:dipeptidyl aminopeptidase/acylaminoacyl peptidase
MSHDRRLSDVTFSSGDVTLAGTLARPDGPGPYPAVVMVGGSGPSNRNNDTLFPPIREHLVGAGIAVLSYDKRGVGESSGSWLASTMDDLAVDAVAALGFLCDQPVVRAEAVGLFGHSEGGWVVLRAAADRDDVSYYDRLVVAARRDAGFIEVATLLDGEHGPRLLGEYWAGLDEPMWEFLKR